LPSFESISASVVPEDHQATIIFEEIPGIATRENALSILRRIGVDAVEFQTLRQRKPSVFQFHIAPDIFHEVVLRLSENGFENLKAFNARQRRTNT